MTLRYAMIRMAILAHDIPTASGPHYAIDGGTMSQFKRAACRR